MSWMIAIDREDETGKIYREGETYNTYKAAAYRIECICVHVAAANIGRCFYFGERIYIQGACGTFP